MTIVAGIAAGVFVVAASVIAMVCAMLAGGGVLQRGVKSDVALSLTVGVCAISLGIAVTASLEALS